LQTSYLEVKIFCCASSFVSSWYVKEKSSRMIFAPGQFYKIWWSFLLCHQNLTFKSLSSLTRKFNR